MEDLVKVENNQVVVSSRQVANDFGKEHRNLLRDIRGMLKNEHTKEMFCETFYVNEQNRQKYSEYLMNRDGFSLLVMGFTGSKALDWKLKYIAAFNEMEAKLKEKAVIKDSYMIDDPIERAKRWIEEQQERKALAETCTKQEQVINELKPKADYVDRILKSKSLMPITAIAKDYGMSGRKMNEVLHQLGIIYKLGKQWLLYEKHQKCGYTASETVEITRSNGMSDVVLHTKWTQKGRMFLYNKLKGIGVLPLIEKNIDN